MDKIRVAFHTLGCKTNSYETQAVTEQFEKNGYDIVGFSETADVYVINTCSVTNTAAQKSRQMLHQAKKKNPKALVVATGCIAQEAGKELLKDADIVVGNNEKSKILDLINDIFRQTSGAQHMDLYREAFDLKNDNDACASRVVVDDLKQCDIYEQQEITNQGNHVRAYVKIQDGCNRFCSYCIIPYLRGRSRSRELKEILNETKILVNNGYKEIVLTGIDISSFEIKGCRRDSLLMLLRELNKIEGLERIRLGSLEVSIITREFAEEISKLEKLCPQFHLSLQSGCDEVLKRMNRHYTCEEYKTAVSFLKGYYENPAITTDIIVGFPKETEEEFKQTVEFAKEIKFSRIHVFPYSQRKGTIADRMGGQLTKAVKDERVKILLEVEKVLEEEYLKSFQGKEVKILVEEVISKNGHKFLTGYSPEYIKFDVEKDGNINDFLKLTVE